LTALVHYIPKESQEQLELRQYLIIGSLFPLGSLLFARRCKSREQPDPLSKILIGGGIVIGLVGIVRQTWILLPSSLVLTVAQNFFVALFAPKDSFERGSLTLSDWAIGILGWSLFLKLEWWIPFQEELKSFPSMLVLSACLVFSTFILYGPSKFSPSVGWKKSGRVVIDGFFVFCLFGSRPRHSWTTTTRVFSPDPQIWCDRVIDCSGTCQANMDF